MNNRYSNPCDCAQRAMPMPDYKRNKSLAMAYVPWQTWQNVMDGCNALNHGTIFEDLVLSFEGRAAACSPCSRNNANAGNANTGNANACTGNVNVNNYGRRGLR